MTIIIRKSSLKKKKKKIDLFQNIDTCFPFSFLYNESIEIKTCSPAERETVYEKYKTEDLKIKRFD